MSDELRGFAAAKARYLKRGRGGGKRSPNAALNVAHVILTAADRPMTGSELVCHALGLGLWSSGSKTPDANLIRVLDVEVGKKDGIVVKPGPGLFSIKPGTPDPMTICPSEVDQEDADGYHEMIADGQIQELNI